jgi:hypothetical protein
MTAVYWSDRQVRVADLLVPLRRNDWTPDVRSRPVTGLQRRFADANFCVA